MTMPSGLRPSNNPFLSPPVLPDAPDAEHLEAARTDKPWGHETLFADGSHGYVGKLIHVLGRNNRGMSGGNFTNGGDITGDDRCATGHRLQHGQAKALIQRDIDQGGRSGIEAGKIGI